MIQTGTLERENGKEKQKKKREKAVQPESEENHFSMLLFHSPLISGCAVQLNKKKKKQYVECVHARRRKKRRKYLPRKKRKREKGKQEIPHYVVIKNGKQRNVTNRGTPLGASWYQVPHLDLATS